MNLLRLPYKILGILNLIYSSQFKQNIKDIDNETQVFYVKNPHKLCR